MKTIPNTLAAILLLAAASAAHAQVCPPEAVDAWGRPDCVIGSVTITPGTGSMGFDSAPPAADPPLSAPDSVVGSVTIVPGTGNLVLTGAPPDPLPSVTAQAPATSVPEPGSLALALLGALGLALPRYRRRPR